MIPTRIFIAFLLLSAQSLSAFAQKTIYDKCDELFRNKNYREAISCYSGKQAASQLDSLSAYYGIAYSFYKIERYDSAKINLALLINRNNIEKKYYGIIGNAYYLLGRIYSKEKEPETELLYLKEANKYIDNSNLNTTIGYDLVKLKRYNDALAYMDKGVQLDSTSDAAYNNRGLVYIKLHQLDKAEQDLKKALKLNTKNPYIYKHLGLLYMNKNDKVLACYYFQAALDKGYREYGNESDKNEIDELQNQICK